MFRYDSFGKLTYAKTVGGKAYYTYDATGNITEIKNIVNDTTTIKTIEYDTTSGWKDRLMKVDGKSLVYSSTAPGLPTTYQNGRTYTLAWNGTSGELTRATVGGNTTSYGYFYGGLRKTKTSGGVTKNYYYDGDRLVAEKWSTGAYLLYHYDENSDIYAITYSSTGSGYSKYYLIKNIQGDVVQLRNVNNSVIACYDYDAWGNLLSVTNAGGTEITSSTSIALINPIRYRGYYYDNETGFYYLQSRYYDPANCRFISADDPETLTAEFENCIQYNLFAYCFNNPINLSDETGTWPSWATIALGAAAAVVAVAVTVVTLGAAAPAAACTLTAIGMSIGANYAVASTAATVAVAATTVATAAYTGDMAYSAVTGDSLLLDTVFQGNTDAYNTGLAITSIATAGMLEMAVQSPGVCFVAGTPVLAACGYIAIEEIKVGEMVWAENPETGEKELKEVVQTFVNETTELIYVQVGSEEIVTTPEHPFYSTVKGWIAACKLRTGDILVLQNDKYVTVEKVQHEILEAPITVYNFEVADFHTYYVGKSSVLVHNDCGGNSSSRGVGGKGWVGDRTWRKNVSTVGKGGTITSLNGGVPSKAQAMQLINQSGGTALRIEGAHQFPNPHNYSHINYVTSTGVKGTIKIFE